MVLQMTASIQHVVKAMYALVQESVPLPRHTWKDVSFKKKELEFD